MSLVSFLDAIGRQEGVEIPGSRAARNNNPGNLDFEPWLAHAFGAVLETPLKGETARFAKFPTLEIGRAALKTLVLKDYLGLSIAQFVAKYAPSTENNTIAYVKNICSFTGFTPSTVLSVNNIG